MRITDVVVFFSAIFLLLMDTPMTLAIAPLGHRGFPKAISPLGHRCFPTAISPLGHRGFPTAASPLGRRGHPTATSPLGHRGFPTANNNHHNRLINAIQIKRGIMQKEVLADTSNPPLQRSTRSLGSCFVLFFHGSSFLYAIQQHRFD